MSDRTHRIGFDIYSNNIFVCALIDSIDPQSGY